jgi:UDP-N-acetylmuramoyl-L-alanyl-D-glutamate--2,6-diaminopimelate ligase
VRLPEVLDALGPQRVDGDPDRDITRVDHDSRQVEPGSLFCCVPGRHHDGHDFAPAAVAAGAVALLVERPLLLDVTQVVVDDVRAAMGPAAAAVAGHPDRDLEIVGVTGTNGKTTTTALLGNVFEAAGRPARVLGTLSGPRTTPEAPDLQRRLSTWRDEGVRSVAMEVSSHALALHRVDGTRFRVAVFTNLSRDHLDFHGSMEAYFQAKARLFTPGFTDAAVVNLESPYGRLLLDAATVPTIGYTTDTLEAVEVGAGASRFRWRGQTIELPLGGAFNVSNALAAAEASTLLGIDAPVVAAGLSMPVSVPGRFEPVEAGQPYTVLVDYAHTPDALDQLLTAARQVAGAGAVTVVFGCGGDRDPSKRPMMGEVAARLADRVVVTADNSRHEDTAAIIDAVLAGTRSVGAAGTILVEPDRRAAIGLAVEGAGAGDVVVIAGKGHETTQTVGDLVTPFDDREVAREEIRQRAGGSEGGSSP